MLLNLIPRQTLCVTSVLILIGFSGCVQVNSLNHQPAMASGRAQQFAEAAFVEHRLPAAYDLLSQAMRNQLSFEQFTDLISKIHPSTYPSSVQAAEYEPLMGQRGMNIYLVGKNNNEQFYYRFFMEGTKETDYTVGGIWRGKGPYPPTNMKKRLN
jgi:hypothetical protein